MAELPELELMRGQMQSTLGGRVIAAVEIRQEKCLNMPAAQMRRELYGKRITAVKRRGKWLELALEPECYLLLNPGMGFDLWRYEAEDTLPVKYQFRLGLDDGSGFTCRFWWFGHIHLLSSSELPLHPETAKLGPCPLAISLAEFRAIAGRYPRGTVKSLVLDQEKLAGIGNAYAHDILWRARLHPLRRLGSLSERELADYYEAMQAILARGIELGGIETDFLRTGGHANDWRGQMLVGYRQGLPCPACGAAIAVIKTGATKTYICPHCQGLGQREEGKGESGDGRPKAKGKRHK